MKGEMGDLNKSTEPMYVHDEMLPQSFISPCKTMYAVCSL